MEVPQDLLLEEISNIISEDIRTLYEIWTECAFEDVGDRQAAVRDSIKQLMTQMVSEEQGNRRFLADRIETLLRECANLTEELGVVISTDGLENLSLVGVERALYSRLKESRMLKERRLAELADLRKNDREISHHLGRNVYPDLPNPVPTEEQLHRFRIHVQEKEEEKEHLSRIFFETKTNILSIIKEMEIGPTTDFERAVICEEDSNFRLTRENMTKLKELHQSLEGKLEMVKMQAEELREKLSNLWGRLMVDYEYRNTFLIANPGYTAKTIAALKAEIRRCEEVKRDNIKQFVERIREELTDWWDKCFYGDGQRRQFLPFYSDCYTEDLLDLHELEVDRMRAYYERSRDIIQLMVKHQSLWKRMLDLESRAHDPDRLFQNRGGQLLREEKERKTISKELPKIGDELKAHLTRFVEHDGSPFLYNGECLSAFLDRQWQEYCDGKEQEKMARKKGRDQLDGESRMGKTTMSSTKRKPPRSVTPAPVPNKAPRIEPSAKRNILAPPQAMEVKRGTVMKKSDDRLGAVSSSSTRQPDIVLTHVGDSTLSASPASYSQFQDHLERRNEEEICRSSVAPGRPVLRERNVSNKPPFAVGTSKSPHRVGQWTTPVKPPRKNLVSRPHTAPRPRGTPRGSPNVPRTPRAVHSPYNRRTPGTAPRLTTPRGKLPFFF